MRLSSKDQLRELLKKPFYLVRLVELFEDNHTLPKSKVEVFEQLFIARIQLDVEHFRTTIELEGKHKTIIETLERLALGMETLGRNYINNDEFQQLIPDKSLRTLINYCTVWKKSERDMVTWQFEHNNFQEYLAARVLSRQPFETIKEFISFEPDYKKIIPSWVNTISFLISISNDPELVQWVLDNEAELAVKFEPDKIDMETCNRIFKEIFNYYKEKKIWINRDKYNYNELAKFGQSVEIIDFLLTEAETATHYTTQSNAIQLIRRMNLSSKQRQRSEHILVECTLDNKNDEQVQNLALIALTDLELNTKEIIEKIVQKHRSSESDWVRFGLYYFLYNSDSLDKFIDIFLGGIKYFIEDKYFQFSSQPTNGSRKTRLLDERLHLKIGLEKAMSPNAIRKIITYFKEHPEYLNNIFSIKDISNIVANAYIAYSKYPSIFDLVIDLFVVLVTKHLEKEAREFIVFFDKTNRRLEVFKHFFSKRKNNEDVFPILATLTNEECIEFFVQKYEEHNVVDEDVQKFRNDLGWKNYEFYLPFNKLINEKTGNKFQLPPKRDFEKERKERRQNDFDLLFDKQAFLKELKLIFDTERRKKLAKQDIRDIQISCWEDPYYSDLAISTLEEIAKNGPVSFDFVNKFVNNGNWQQFSIAKIYEFLKDDNDLVISEEHREWISKWCDGNLDKVDFMETLVTHPDGHASTSWQAIYLWFFLRRLDLKYPRDVLLDMLSFDCVERFQMVGIQYLEEQLQKADITKRILKNLRKGIQNNNILRNHIDYCKRNKIREVLPYALNEITNTGRNEQVRIVALETICEIAKTLSELEQKLPEITDDFRWNVIEQLIKYNSKYCHKFLLGILLKGDEQGKFKAAEYLIRLQDLRGLKYYVEWIKRHKIFPESLIGKSPILSLRVIESMPFLIKLLKISYQDEFVQNGFDNLKQAVLNTLSSIALQSDQNYFKIKETIENFIKNYSSTIKNVNFLYMFLEKLEQKHFAVKSQELDINDVIKKLEKILISG